MVINRKLLWPVLGAGLLILTVLAVNILGRGGAEKLQPEVLFARSLSQTAATESFRYKMQVAVGREDWVSSVEGERVAPDRIHIRGTMQKTPLEFIHISGITYMKDPWSEGWLTIPESSLSLTELFIAELNPLGILDFKGIQEIKSLGRKKVAGEVLTGLEIKPLLKNALLESGYRDFLVQVWVDPRTCYIRSATLEGAGSGGEADKIVIKLEIWDYNSKLEINKPPGV
ncbi:MAG: hypothetical protein AB1815_02815 [Bacillota bacterium]